MGYKCHYCPLTSPADSVAAVRSSALLAVARLSASPPHLYPALANEMREALTVEPSRMSISASTKTVQSSGDCMGGS